MARLVVCADGTWNTPEQKEDDLPAPTNVVKFFNALPEDTEDQRKYYHPGVGSAGSLVDRLLDGGMGRGLNANIQSAYNWLAVNYQPEDDIYLIGFSRGAYTVRSLGGMLSWCGLLDFSDASGPTKDRWDRIEKVFDAYRNRDNSKISGLSFHQGGNDGRVGVRFLGVWDTVGALGIPDDLAILNLIDDPREYAFHDTKLSDIVQTARHAVAMDEMRQSFAPTFWTGFASDRDIQQIWFPGVHGDVGGGYSRTGLSDGALLWMIKEAGKAGLKFRDEVAQHVKPDPFDVLHDSRTGIFSALKTEPRHVPNLADDNAPFHRSARRRHKNPPLVSPTFWPTRVLAPGDTFVLDVFAGEHWNVTRLFLEANIKYDFRADGEWLDSNVPAGPGGTADGTFHVGEVAHIAASALGHFETVFRTLSGNRSADFFATKRVEDHPWFALIGVVANGAGPRPDKQELPTNEMFLIGRETTFTPKEGGYLYCFANDAWHAYSNNKGHVTLTVSR